MRKRKQLKLSELLTGESLASTPDAPSLGNNQAAHTALGYAGIGSGQTGSASDLSHIETNIKNLIEETRKKSIAHAREVKSRTPLAGKLTADAGARHSDDDDEKKLMQRLAQASSSQTRLKDQAIILTDQIEKLQANFDSLDAAIKTKDYTIETLTDEQHRLAELKNQTDESVKQALESCRAWQDAATQEITAHAHTRADCEALQKREEELRQEIERRSSAFIQKLRERKQTMQAQIDNLRKQLDEIKQIGTLRQAFQHADSIPPEMQANTPTGNAPGLILQSGAAQLGAQPSPPMSSPHQGSNASEQTAPFLEPAIFSRSEDRQPMDESPQPLIWSRKNAEAVTAAAADQPTVPPSISEEKTSGQTTAQDRFDTSDRLQEATRRVENERDELSNRLEQLESMIRVLADGSQPKPSELPAETAQTLPPAGAGIVHNPRLRLRDLVIVSLLSAIATIILLFLLIFFITQSSAASTGQLITQHKPDPSAPDTPANRLLDSARLWVEKDRVDLALEAAQKAHLLEPNNPAILARVGELQLKMNQTAQASETLKQLQSRFPDTEATRAMEDAYRLATKDRIAMATVEFLAQDPRRVKEGIRALRALFPNGAPHGEVALAYYHMLGRAPGFQDEAKAGIERLIKEMPNDPRPQLELADVLVDSPTTLPKGLEIVAALAQRDDIKPQSVLRVWKSGLYGLERNAQTERYFKTFEAAFPDVKPVPQLVFSPQELALRRQRQLDDQVYELIRNADAAYTGQQPEEARRLLDKALQINPANKEAQLAMAKIELALGNHPHAQELYNAVLQTDPVNSRAVNGMVDTLIAGGRRKEALEFAADYARTHPQQAEDVAHIRATLLRAESDDLLKRGLTQQAQSLLEQGIGEIPSAAWLRYDLANLYARMGFAEKSKKLFDDMPIAATPEDNAENLYTEALFLSAQSNNAGAIGVIERIPAEQRSDSIKALLLKSSVRSALAEAVQTQGKGKHGAAVKLLQHAEELAKDSPEITWECAEGWAEIGEPNRGLTLGKRLLASSAEPALATDNTLRYARLLYKAGRTAEVGEKIAAVESKSSLTPQQKEELLTVKRMYAIRKAWELRGLGKPREAEALLVKNLEQQPDDTGLLTTLADILYLDDKPEQASVIYRNLIGKNPQAFDTRLSQVKTLRAMGKNEEALSEIARLGREIPPGDRSNRRVLAEQLAAEDDFPHARGIINDLLRTQPDDKKTLMQAATIEKQAKEYERALDFLHRIEKPGSSGKPASLEDATLTAGAALQIQEIEQRRYGYVTSGVDYRELSGTAGMSQISNIEAPLQIRVPVGYDGHVFVQTDYANAFAGKLNLSSYSTASQFGKVNALCNGSLSCVNGMQLSGSANQAASGAPIAIGYHTDDWRFDIGSGPIGFPVNSVVGGVRHSGSIGKAYYSWDLSRRPLSNSLLSYAGVHDPVTGAVWGGVKANGGGVYVGADYGQLGLFAQGAAHYIEGQNVLSNYDVMLRTGADWSFINDEDMRLSVGLAGMYWTFGNNQRHYTFGYGGYWSPQSYFSIAPPVQWTGRWGDLSYLFRGYVSYSWSSENGGKYYPINPELQSNALNNNSNYAGSYSTAVSWGLRGVLEYQLAPQWFLGGRAEIARSPFYTPNYFGLYFRYAFDERKEKIPFPPEPPVPYYRY